jgi:MSHA pilin protein MshC
MRWARKAAVGFTLIELIATMAIVSILAVFAGAKADLFSGIDDAGAAQSMAAYVGAAQRLAIANRRSVWVAITPNSLSVCYDSACAVPCASMDGRPMRLSSPSGAFMAPAAALMFDTQGRPSFSGGPGPFVINHGSQSVRVEPETGLTW